MANEYKHSWVTERWPSQHIVKSNDANGNGEQFLKTYCGLRADFTDPSVLGLAGMPTEGRTCESCFRNRERA